MKRAQKKGIDVRYVCFALDIELLEGEYDDDKWFESVKGFEACPEKGDRCAICFDGRFEDGMLARAADDEGTLRGFVLLGATASKQRLTLTKLVPDLIPAQV